MRERVNESLCKALWGTMELLKSTICMCECGPFTTYHLDFNLGPVLMVCIGAVINSISSLTMCTT